MAREDQLRKDTADRLDAAISESRRLGPEPGDLENADLLSTIAAKELRIQELLEKLDTATRLRLMDADDLRERPKTDRRTRGSGAPSFAPTD